MAIRVDHSPSAAIVAPAAYAAGAGMYRQRQSERAQQQYNQDRAFAQQAYENDQARQFQREQADRQQQNTYLAAAIRMQENQQQGALQQQQLAQRAEANQQAAFADQQAITQKGLQSGALRYTTAQKQQMAKLYADWDKVNSAKNLNERDRAVAQQQLQQQFRAIQPRPVLEDERPKSFAEVVKERVLFANGQDPSEGQWISDKDGNPKWYPPRNTGAAGTKKPEVGQPGQPFYLPDDNPLGETPGEAYGVWGPDGKVIPNPNHKWNKKGGETKQPDATKDFDAMLKHAKDLFKQHQEGGMTWDEAKEQAKADFEERQATAATQDEFDAATPPAKQTAWNAKQETRRKYAELHKAAGKFALPFGGGTMQDSLPSPEDATPEEMAALLKRFSGQQQAAQPPTPQPPQSPQQPQGQHDPLNMTPEEAAAIVAEIRGQAPQPPQPMPPQAPQQQAAKRPTFALSDKWKLEEELLKRMPRAYDKYGQEIDPKIRVGRLFYGENLEGLNDPQEKQIANVLRNSPELQKWADEQGMYRYDLDPEFNKPPQADPRQIESSLQAAKSALIESMHANGLAPQSEADIVKHYTQQGGRVPPAAVRQLTEYLVQKYGDNIENIAPEDKQLEMILAAAAKQAAAEAKRNPDQKQTALRK
jgi:hypothetical protein